MADKEVFPNLENQFGADKAPNGFGFQENQSGASSPETDREFESDDRLESAGADQATPHTPDSTVETGEAKNPTPEIISGENPPAPVAEARYDIGRIASMEVSGDNADAVNQMLIDLQKNQKPETANK